MRKVSPTNSRPWEDLHEQYMYGVTHLDDEIVWAFPGDLRDAIVPISERQTVNISRCMSTGSDVHHISGGILGTPRWDVSTNLIKLCRVTHQFCDKWVAPGFVLCAASKIRSGDWDSQKMCEIMHVDSILGFLEARMPFQFEHFVMPVFEKYRSQF